jgi:hypothetical protein
VDAGQITTNNTAQHNAAQHARAQREEVVATAGKPNVGYPNDLLQSEEVMATTGKSIVGYPNDKLKSVLYGKSVLFPKSERYLNNVLYLKSVELMATTGKINAGTLNDPAPQPRHTEPCYSLL